MVVALPGLMSIWLTKELAKRLAAVILKTAKPQLVTLVTLKVAWPALPLGRLSVPLEANVASPVEVFCIWVVMLALERVESEIKEPPPL